MFVDKYEATTSKKLSKYEKKKKKNLPPTSLTLSD